MADLFLSYAREDLDQARSLASALEAEGWTVFWDRRIPPGRNFEVHLEQQLSDCRAVLVLWSPHSVSSHWVRIEAAQGRDRGILIPILIAPATIPFGYGQIHAADLTAWQPGQRGMDFEELLGAIERMAPRASVPTGGARDQDQQALRDPSPAPQRAWLRFETVARIALILLIASVFFTTLWHPSTDISASITAHQVDFPYRLAGGPESTTFEKQLLVGNAFDELAVTPFESIVLPPDTSLSVAEISPDIEHIEKWIPVVTKGTPKIVATSPDAKAAFKSTMLEKWELEANVEPWVTMAANAADGKRALSVTLEKGSKSVFLTGSDIVIFQCQLCRIDNAADQKFAREFRAVNLRASGFRSRSLQVNPNGSSLTLNVTPGPEGLKKEEFRFQRLRFCGGTKPPDVRSTVVSAKMTFKAVGRTETVLGEGSTNLPYSALRLDADSSFLATQFALVDGGERGAIKLDFHGKARTAVIADVCDGPGSPVLPSLFDGLSNRPSVRALGVGLGFLLFWLGGLGKLWNVVTRRAAP